MKVQKNSIYLKLKRRQILKRRQTLLEGVCIRPTHVMNMKEVLCMFDNCHSLGYVTFNAKMTLFDLTLPITKTSQTMSSLH